MMAKSFTPALAVRTVAAWAVTLLIFFPIGFMLLTSFKTEANAYTTTPHLVFSPTLSQYSTVFHSGIWPYVANSAFATIVRQGSRRSSWNM